jgi:hypothetical protein
MRDGHKIVMMKSKENSPLQRCMCGWKVNDKVDITEICTRLWTEFMSLRIRSSSGNL